MWRRAMAASVPMAWWPSAASAAAAPPKARSAGMGSSPARRPRSCSPPTSNGSNLLPRLTTSAPAPGTPPSLWALTLTRSASSAPRSVGTWPHAAAASTCTMTPASRQSPTTSWTGWSVPTSWLPHWQCTSAGRGSAGSCRRSRRASTSSRPSASTPISRLARRGPRHRGRRSARRRRRARARPGAARVAPQTAALMASVAPEVKTTWRATTPSSSATWSRALSSASRTVRPSSWIRPGSPGGSAAHCPNAARASGRGGVVLAWSR